MILLTSRIRCHQAKNSIFPGSWSKTQNSGQNRIYPSLSLDRKIFPFKKGFKKYFPQSEVIFPYTKTNSIKKRMKLHFFKYKHGHESYTHAFCCIITYLPFQSILEQNKILLEFNCVHFGNNIESLRVKTYLSKVRNLLI